MKDLRPQYHITALSNWINDPNGVVKFKGKYHVFFQHHPYGLKWGPMHWGHVISDDLLHWEHLPFALTPGDDFDKDGCFSGSAIVYNDKLYLIYTGFIFNEDGEKIRQHQCLAYSEDGIHFKKLGLIIGEDNLPIEFAPNDFRDPIVYKENGKFVMLVAARRKGGRGNILRYESNDLFKWKYISDILPNDSKGIMIECPDYIKDLNLLTYCEQFQPNEGNIHLNIHSTFWEIGEFKNNKFISKNKGIVDYGFDFYAPQTIKGDNILIGWMDMWDRNQPSEIYGFAGSLSIPRKLEIRDNELFQTPIHPNKEEVLSTDFHTYEGHHRLGFFKLDLEGLESFSLKVRGGGKEETTFVLKGDEWIFDRSKSGVEIQGSEKDGLSKKGIRIMPYIKKEKHDVYIVLDEFSIEIFVDGKSLTSLIYPHQDSDLFTLKIKAKKSRLIKYFN